MAIGVFDDKSVTWLDCGNSKAVAVGSLGCWTGQQIGLEAALLDFKTIVKIVEPVEQCGGCSMLGA